MNLYILALHIIFIVTWFAGLFYIVRLFVYHAEADKKEEPERSILQKQYKIMEKRLWYGIAWPSMIFTIILGGWLLWLNPGLFNEDYFKLKLCFVGGLILYHLQCHNMFRQFRNDLVKYTSFKLRLWNEGATIFLVAIVFLIVLKSNTDFVRGLLGLLLFSVIIFLAIRIYRNRRKE